MPLQAESASGDAGINADLFPPSRFITGAMDLTMVSAAKWHCELVTDLAAQRWCLRKPQMMGIGRTATADQAHECGAVSAAPARFCRLLKGGTAFCLRVHVLAAAQLGASRARLGHLTLVNEAAKTINADLAGGVLTLDTGNGIVNIGVLEASNGGTLQVQDLVTGGSAVIAGGIMQFDAATSIAVTFDNGTAGTSYGLLMLIDPSHFTGNISGFAGTAPDLTHSDGIDVIGLNFNSGQFSDSYDSSTGSLTLSDGTNTENATIRWL
jgi:hypothetical protein